MTTSIVPRKSPTAKIAIACFGTCGAIVLLLILIAVAMTSSQKQNFVAADRGAREFLTDVSERHADAAYRLTSSELQQNTSSSAFAKIVDQWRDMTGDFGDISLQGKWWYVGTGGTRITLVYIIHGSKGEEKVGMVLLSRGSNFVVGSCNFAPYQQ